MNNLTKIRTQPAHEKSPSWHIEASAHNDAWDLFLENNFGHHVQTTEWSRAKSINGWSTKRIIASSADQIRGGAQILIRRMGAFGSIGYAPKIPEFIEGSDELADELLEQVRQLAIAERLQVLLIQPAENGLILERMHDFGFRPCPVEIAPSATVLVELSDDLDAILARMTKGMRNGVRRSENRGITVREGTRHDLATFHRLLTQTSQRRGFSTFEFDYFQGMWDIFAPTEKMKVFLSEFKGQPVSAQVCIAFGNKVVAKQIGWSGEHRKLHPNEALDWFTIQWAKSRGYKYYDLEGIERQAAIALSNGQSLPKNFANSPTSYKLRLGGEVRLDPSAYCFVANPILRSMYNQFGYRFAKWPIVKKAVSRFRTS